MRDEIKRRNNEEEVKVICPVVSIQEKETEIFLNAEMPGIQKDKLSVEVHGEELTISAKRVNDVPKGYTPFIQERIPVEYRRVFSLGNQINKETIAAQYKDGILQVCLKKTATAQPKKITIA